MRRLATLLALAGGLLLAPAAPAQAAIAWCGNDQLPGDRPDMVGGRKVHVVYAIPSDGADRFREAASQIVTDLAAVSNWWRREDPSRAPRWDLFPFPGCEIEVARLDLSFVRLPRPTEAYFEQAGRLAGLATDLSPALDDPAKKYLVYYDGPVAQGRACGSAFGRDDPMRGGWTAMGGVYVQSNPGLESCGILGTEGYVAATAAHELVHMLGGVPNGAPNACPGDAGHICDDSADIMASSGRSPWLTDYALDPGRDDYYGHAGSWWDIQDSPWLATTAPDRRLAVKLVRARAGTAVTSTFAGISCPGACALPWADGDRVTLAVATSRNDRFLRWEGACSGREPCRLVMDADREVRAVFGPAFYRLALRVDGRGRVTSGGLVAVCRTRCAGAVSADGVATLRAFPDRGWRFAGWKGCAPQRKAVCRVRLSRDTPVRATFVRIPPRR